MRRPLNDDQTSSPPRRSRQCDVRQGRIKPHPSKATLNNAALSKLTTSRIRLNRAAFLEHDCSLKGGSLGQGGLVLRPKEGTLFGAASTEGASLPGPANIKRSLRDPDCPVLGETHKVVGEEGNWRPEFRPRRPRGAPIKKGLSLIASPLLTHEGFTFFSLSSSGLLVSCDSVGTL